MYKIEFYETINGLCDVRDFLDSLREKADKVKDARIQFSQMVRYLELLRINGTNLPTEITKHLEDNVWELRPGNNRVLYFYFEQDTFVLLHHFRKKTQKTPRREILKAKAEIKDYLERKDKLK